MTLVAPDPLDLVAEALDPTPPPYEGRPVEWTNEVLREELWSKQRSIMRAVVTDRFVAVKSCHASGKSHLASRIASWWLDQHPPGEAFVVTTAPTWPQVRAVVWRYIGQAHAKGKLRGRVNQTEWWMDPLGTHRTAPHPTEGIVAYGRKPADTSPEGFQGIHAKYVLVLIDEAGGVPKMLWDAVDTLATNVDCRVLAIGNPDDPDSHFAKVCRPGSDWTVFTISAFDTPAYHQDPDDPDYEPVTPDLLDLLVSPEWVEERKIRWGEGTPLYIAKVLGEFPEDASDTVIPLSYVKRAQRDREGVYKPDELDPIELGVDVGAGGDLTVIYERTGVRAGRKWSYNTPDAMDAVGKVLLAIRETQATSVKVDSIGVGHGVADRLEELRKQGKHSAAVHRVNVATTPRDRKRFHRLRDELWWNAREACGLADGRPALWDLSEIDDDTVADLTAPKYTNDSQGRYIVEEKDDTKKRLGHSPDDADALLLAFYVPPTLRGGQAKVRDKRRKGRR